METIKQKLDRIQAKKRRHKLYSKILKLCFIMICIGLIFEARHFNRKEKHCYNLYKNQSKIMQWQDAFMNFRQCIRGL